MEQSSNRLVRSSVIFGLVMAVFAYIGQILTINDGTRGILTPIVIFVVSAGAFYAVRRMISDTAVVVKKGKINNKRVLIYKILGFSLVIGAFLAYFYTVTIWKNHDLDIILMNYSHSVIESFVVLSIGYLIYRFIRKK